MQDYILFKKSYEKKLYILICNFMIQKFLYPISTNLFYQSSFDNDISIFKLQVT